MPINELINPNHAPNPTPNPIIAVQICWRLVLGPPTQSVPTIKPIANRNMVTTWNDFEIVVPSLQRYL